MGELILFVRVSGRVSAGAASAPHDSTAMREQALALYREKHGLLSGEEIRAIRERFGLGDAQEAERLRAMFLDPANRLAASIYAQDFSAPASPGPGTPKSTR